jgi:hypothetical protein
MISISLPWPQAISAGETRVTTPLPLPTDETRPGSFTVQRPRMSPFSPMTLPLSHPPAHSVLPHTLDPLRVLLLSLPCPPCLPVAGAHVTPPEGGSLVCGPADISAGGPRSPWTVTGPLSYFDLLARLTLVLTVETRRYSRSFLLFR